MKTIRTDYVDLGDLINVTKSHYETLELITKKSYYLVKIKARNRTYKWKMGTRAELIFLLSGLLGGYEISNNK